MGQRLWVCIAVLLVACGDNLEPPPDDDTVIRIALDTHAPVKVAAGDTITVSCTLLENDIESMVTGEVRVTAETSVMRMNGAIVARKAGSVEVACMLPDRGIVDPTPAVVEIVAGAAANLVTTITPDPVTAGNSVTATCEIYDAYGNPVTEADEPVLQLQPDDSANTVTDLEALMTRAGHYTGRCYLPGTTSNNAPFDVVPNLPATLAISKFPDLPVYSVGSIVEVMSLVTDRYGNEIFSAPVTKGSAALTGLGPTTNVGPGQWRYDGEGSYRVTVTVSPPTDGNVVLSASTDIVVNSRGPAITCNNDATMLNVAPGSTITVSGQANDVNGVSSITVNGMSVAVGAGGAFSRNLTTRYGINFVDVTALDTFGEPTTKVCTFLVSNRYNDPAATMHDAVSLKLTQSAVDDGTRNATFNSLGDLLHTVMNSPGLQQTVHGSLSAANPLKPSSCDQQTCTFLGCICWFRSEVRYQDSELPGPNTVSLALVDGGLRAVARMDNIRVNLRVRGSVSGIGYDTSGWVTLSSLEVQLTLDLALVGGSPAISVRGGSVSSTVGSISTNFSGVDGWIINNVVVPLAQGQLRDTLRNLIQTFVTNNFNSVLDGLIGNLDISTLGTTFNVPRIDGSGNVPMSFGVGFSSVSTTTSRAIFGIGTRFTAPPANSIATRGVPMPPGTNLLDPTVSSPANTGVGAYVGIVQHALYALWRANYFRVTLSGTQIGTGLPAGTSLVVTTNLPPVATILANGTVQLQLGAMDLAVQHPDLPTNMAVRLGADAHASVALVGNDIRFSGIIVDTVHVGTDDINLDPQQQTDLETVLGQLVQQIVNQSLNNALPAIPIPAFTIPASLGQYGLPAGQQVGVVSPVLSVAPQHFTLRGQLGIR
jgi:hypothetical protein